MKKQNDGINREFIRARKLQAKITRLQNMRASYKFRLAAILATDNRPGTFHR